ncbi:pentapeptide repeat-containing protein [Mucilaginibacter sp. PPCGB 2223]|uniref:pentapeptide repeat-containing protein n=1 Tax=Mucilaginibacter sp. PPCGB 2223 TaxID=1886027 RepID=UPI001586A155
MDCSNTDFTGATFADCNLKEIDLRNANLTNATMTRCLVESALFTGADITNFRFIQNYYYGLTLNQDDLAKLVENERRRSG